MDSSPTVRQLLVRLALFMQIPTAVAIGGLLASYWDNEMDHAVEHMREASFGLATSLQERFEGVQQHMDRLAQSVPQNEADLPEFHRKAVAVARQTGVDAVILLRASGQQVVNTRVPFGTALPMTPDVMLRAIRTNRPAVYDLALAPIAGVPVVGAGVPVVKGSRIVYALNAGIEATRFRELLRQAKLPEGWSAGFADRGGIVVAHSSDHDHLVGTPLPAAMLERIQRADLGFFDVDGPNGDALQIYYRRSPVIGWTSFVTVPRKVLLAPIRAAALQLGVALAAIVALSVWGAMRVSRRLVRSIDVLRESARSLPARREIVLPPLGFREATELGGALQESWRALQQANVQLSTSEQRLASILRTAGNPVIVVDRHHCIVLFNDAAESTFGRTTRSATGTSLQDFFTTRSWQRYCEHCSISGLGGEVSGPPRPIYGVCRRASGETFPAELLVSGFTDPLGERYCLLIVRDITTRLRSQRSLLAAHRDVQRVNEGFQRALVKETDARMGHLARELHDSVGSSLAGISLLVETGRSLATAPRLITILEKVQEQVQDTAEHVRRISRGMMPAGSDAGALLPALEQFAQARQEEGLWCSVRARGDFNAVGPDVAGQLYRIVQEAVTNAQRHGAATRIRITLARAGRRYRLTVADNGSGGKLRNVPSGHPGLGLKSMRARAAAIEGQLNLDCGSAAGCRIRVTWRLSCPGHDAGHSFSAGAT